MAFTLHVYAGGRLQSIEFFDGPGFALAKQLAVSLVQSSQAEVAEIHDDCAGLVFRTAQRLH